MTGAARRVGSAIARALAERGTNLVIHCRRSIREAESLAVDLRVRHGVQVEVLQARLENVAEVKKMAVAALKKLKTIHILVNNASIYEQNQFGRTSEKDWNKHLDANLRAPFL
ncbi:MAG: SDR family NAD(P)-dependent oxidoreductase, partial [Elusimicrobia bacterium]|nr:SDR family NAD(P)-dependent oxidoreductase [Elusimicrobiota bacterium]